jgi:uncharacterized integral membrane protein
LEGSLAYMSRYRDRAGERTNMQFLKTLFWVLIAVIVVLFASRNWIDVTINLWGNLLADINLPLLLLIVFLLGMVPTWLIMRARLWASRRRVEALERTQAPITNQPAPEPEGELDAEPAQ